MTLQERFPDLTFYTPKEACESVGFTFDYDEAEEEITNIRCCGQAVRITGLIGAEVAYCEKCGKRIQDITGIHRVGNACAAYIDFKKEEIELPNDGRVWYIPKD